MKKVILTFGSIAGLICIALFYAKMPRDGQFDFNDNSQLYGYITMAIAEVYFSKFGDGFVDQYISFKTEQLVESGLTTAEATSKLAPDIEMMETYRSNTLMRMAFTSIEILPVGLLISLLSALLFGVILKNKPLETTL